jgi:hypothetical protein
VATCYNPIEKPGEISKRNLEIWRLEKPKKHSKKRKKSHIEIAKFSQKRRKRRRGWLGMGEVW